MGIFSTSHFVVTADSGGRRKSGIRSLWWAGAWADSGCEYRNSLLSGSMTTAKSKNFAGRRRIAR
jgi:hypothetical protein